MHAGRRPTHAYAPQTMTNNPAPYQVVLGQLTRLCLICLQPTDKHLLTANCSPQLAQLMLQHAPRQCLLALRVLRCLLRSCLFGFKRSAICQHLLQFAAQALLLLGRGQGQGAGWGEGWVWGGGVATE